MTFSACLCCKRNRDCFLSISLTPDDIIERALCSSGLYCLFVFQTSSVETGSAHKFPFLSFPEVRKNANSSLVFPEFLRKSLTSCSVLRTIAKNVRDECENEQCLSWSQKIVVFAQDALSSSLLCWQPHRVPLWMPRDVFQPSLL